MKKIEVYFTNAEEHENYSVPEYKTEWASGADLKANHNEVLKPGEIKLIHTGIAVAVPEGYEMQIRPRSGLALKNGISLVNSPGTVDADYRGEVGVIMINLGKEDFIIKSGDRIAQAVICPVVQAEYMLVRDLEETERGAGGYGSTGQN